MSKSFPATIVNIGPLKSHTLESSGVDLVNLNFTGRRILRAAICLSKIVRTRGFSSLNVFDMRVLSIAMIAAHIAKVPIVLTKPGGPNPGKYRYYPALPNLVVFSMENYDYFKERRRFAGTRIEFLPNRVAPVSTDTSRREALSNEIRFKGSRFIMVARICAAYESQISASISLVKKLNSDGSLCGLVIVGVPEERDVLDRIRSQSSAEVQIIVDDRFTISASQILNAGDMVIGSGRTLMEATSLGKPVLTPALDHPYPVLITGKTFQSAVRTNFSPRNRLPGIGIEDNLRVLHDLIEDRDSRTKVGDENRELFESYFNVSQAIPKYKTLFSDLKSPYRLDWFALLHASYSTIRSFAAMRKIKK
jgi:glycosyltransferase involved in cell wall biosynthesis